MSDEQKPKRKKPHPASLPGHPNYKPASGIPPGGDGYGPASGKPARAFTTEYRPDPELTEAGKAAARDLTLREMAIAERKANIETWKAIRDDPTAPHMARITAAAKLAERSDGMPAQMVDVTTRSATAAPIKSEDLDDVELDVLHDVLLRAVTKKGDE